MLFNSLQFLVFFMVVTLLFFRIRHQQGRIWLLLLSSCYFYMSFVPVYICILGITIIVDYFAGIRIERSKGASRRRWLILSLIFNVGFLAFFKYFNFFIDNVNTGLGFIGSSTQFHLLEIILPIGLSFHTFQAMSYTIEVYRGHQPAERNFTAYAVYVMFYPQLVAGPIERPQNMLPQLKTFAGYDRDNVKEGIAMMLWGFFKKVVIADRLAMMVDHIFAGNGELSSLALVTGAILYSFQIYCDFSGYTDIGIGAARVMGIKLMTNFNLPLFSRSVTEYWRRWHISLSTWFSDYLYSPTAVRLRNWGKMAVVFSLFFTFFISGLWHGAGWTFITWGILHGIAMAYEFLTKKKRKKLFNKLPLWLNSYLSLALTFSYVTFALIFFRAESIAQAFQYIKGIVSLRGGSNYIGLSKTEIMFSAIAIVVMMVRERKRPQHFIASNAAFRWYVALMIVVCYLFGVFGENQFIYFQF